MPTNVRDSLRMNLSQGSQPPAPELPSRDPTAQQSKIDALKAVAIHKKIKDQYVDENDDRWGGAPPQITKIKQVVYMWISR